MKKSMPIILALLFITTAGPVIGAEMATKGSGESIFGFSGTFKALPSLSAGRNCYLC